MTDITIKAGKGEEAKSVQVSYDLPTDLAGYVSKYGEEMTADFARRSVTLGIQALVRPLILEGKSTEEIQAHVNNWVPGVRGPRTQKSPLERATAVLGNMSAEELAELLAKVKAAEKAAQRAAH